jgi:N6-adenosine-specific RNA methylase IME4
VEAVCSAPGLADVMAYAPFTTIVADPPWDYKEKAGSSSAYRFGAYKVGGERKDVEGYYPLMKLADITALPVPTVVADDAHLYLWTTNAFVVEAHELCRAWGFEPRALLTWVKPQIGVGYYFRNNTEHVVFGLRGRLRTLRRDCPTAFTARRRAHSEKPEEFVALVESMSPASYLEMFARRPRAGWVVWGNQVNGKERV